MRKLFAVALLLSFTVFASGCVQQGPSANDARMLQQLSPIEAINNGSGIGDDVYMQWNISTLDLAIPKDQTIKIENLTLMNKGTTLIEPDVAINGNIAGIIKDMHFGAGSFMFKAEPTQAGESYALKLPYVRDGIGWKGPLYFRGDEACLPPNCCNGTINARWSGVTASVNVRVCTQNILSSKNAKDICEETGGYLCEEHEACDNTIALKETDRCCSYKCDSTVQYEYSSKRHCEKNPTFANKNNINYCHCEPNEEKNKVAAVVAKDGIYDSDPINSQISKYFESVKKDLNIENAGLKKFEGKTIDELDKFADNLYLDDDVAYIILIGEDLPVADINETNLTNLRAINDKLACVNKDCFRMDCVNDSCTTGVEKVCHDVAFSYILPPVLYSAAEKIDFVLKILETYTDYHNNFLAKINEYQKSILYVSYPFDLPEFNEIVIQQPADRPKEDVLGYGFPVVKLLDIEFDKINDELKKKNIVFYYSAHGSPTEAGTGISNEPYSKLKEYAGLDYSALVQQSSLTQNYTRLEEYWSLMHTTLEDYSNFTKQNGLPSLFVDGHACGFNILEQENARYCCWPQIYTESGVWAYLLIIEPGHESFKVRENFANGGTLGLASRKEIVLNQVIFGDVLAHMK